ncbi:hypothetical protein [Tomitella cavernea]|uniref:Secreted protein n=1 Tax=Tomitella cavernea TaxID=1387982 RepID=A0ABP9D1J9_9ACTN|nr:hypothetical protein [Tomitella cavernea]
MKTLRMGAGIAAAAAAAMVAAPAVANAADAPTVDVNVNVSELTATNTGATTKVTFAPGTPSNGETCMGPIVLQGQLTEQQIDQISDTAISGDDTGVDPGQFTAVLPDGLKSALESAGLYTSLLNYMAQGDESKLDMLLSSMFSVVNAPLNGMISDVDLPDGMTYSDGSNTFTYTLDADDKYTAIGECFTGETTGEGDDAVTTITDADLYILTIGYSADTNTGGDNTGGGSLGSLFGSLSGS